VYTRVVYTQSSREAYQGGREGVLCAEASPLPKKRREYSAQRPLRLPRKREETLRRGLSASLREEEYSAQRPLRLPKGRVVTLRRGLSASLKKE